MSPESAAFSFSLFAAGGLALLLPLGALSALKWRISAPVWFATPWVVAGLTLLSLASGLREARAIADEASVEVFQSTLASELAEPWGLSALGFGSLVPLLALTAAGLALTLVLSPGQGASWRLRAVALPLGVGWVLSLLIGLLFSWSWPVGVALGVALVALPRARWISPPLEPDLLVERRLRRLATGQLTVSALVVSGLAAAMLATVGWHNQEAFSEVATAAATMKLVILQEHYAQTALELAPARWGLGILALVAGLALWPLRRWVVDGRSAFGAGMVGVLAAGLVVLLLHALAA